MTASNNTTNDYNPADMWLNFQLAANAVRNVDHNLRSLWLNEDDPFKCGAYSLERDARSWVRLQLDRFELHPVIKAAIDVCRPHDWHQLFLEWPHASQGDRTRIAYTQNEDKGRRDIQTVTSVGKYLTRHFGIPDHNIRDLVARYGTAASFKFVHTTAEMIFHLHRGPGSCMVWREDRGVHCTDGVTRHPYEAYNPKYGWHMAVRIEGDDTVGRALCMTSPDTGLKYYVRTYAKAARSGGYSETDNAMENWLSEQGYEKRHHWRDGEKLAYISTCNEFLAPYLDGNDKRVSMQGDHILIDSNGNFICDQTGGEPTDDSGDYFECEDCGDRTEYGDGYWVGYNEDSNVCVSCYENEYVYGYGRNGRQYTFLSSDATYVESQSEYFHDNYFADNNIVELENGEYESLDEAVEVDGDWYHIDDERICRTEDTDEYLLCDNGCWQCEETGNWYSDSIDFVEVDGKKYHPEDAPEPTPDATLLTLSMLDELSLWEDRTIQNEMVRFSMSILHDGVKLYAHRDVPSNHIATFGLDQVRISMRQIISTELMHMAHINAHLKLEATDTI
jgi:hypothetical protein